MGLMLLLVEISLEFVISTRSTSVSLVRMALCRVSNATGNDTNARVKLRSETLMGLYWMLSGLWSYYLTPTGGGGWK